MRQSSYSHESTCNRVRDMYPEFAKQCPVLFGSCCDPDFPLEMLEMMLRHMDAVKHNGVPKERATDNVLHHLNSHYVDPVLSGLEKKRRDREGCTD